jgi:2-(S-pantetheinyl)-carbapenam-3-carboxylate methyltransferase
MNTIFFLSLNPIRFVPYAYGLLRAWCEQDPRLKEHYRWAEPLCWPDRVEDLAAAVTDPFILCASCYVWNHEQHLYIARLVKERYPDCRVVFGGPHIPREAEAYLALHGQVDVLVHDEGEMALQGLLHQYLLVQADLVRVPGISFRGTDGVVTTAPLGLPRDLPVQSPFLQGYFESYLKAADGHAIGLWETNRGCPYGCSFCDWGARTTNKVRRHAMDKIKAEIDYLASHRIEDIYLTDCNFGLFERDLEITRLLVASKQRSGYPKRVRIQFAKQSDERVLEISRLLNADGMLWGTTLSMQSVTPKVLKAVKRQFLGIDKYARLKKRYQELAIPTYTELILGLPLETRQSFITGISRLFEIGIHDDIRVFELALLPNAPLSRPEERRRYGLQTRFKPLRRVAAGQPCEKIELVFATATMPYEDWALCLLFGEMIQAFHNGGYTRFLAIYLHDAGLVDYRTFYEGLLDWMRTDSATVFDAVRRLERLIHDFYHDPEMPQIHRILTQPDIMAFLERFNPGRKGWPLWSYPWLWTAEHLDAFYQRIQAFLISAGVAVDPVLNDLLRYQKELMLQPEYDPAVGKTVSYDYNWFDVFFNDKDLKQESMRLHYSDTHMGIGHRYALAKGDRHCFINAAIGMSYPYSKLRHFFHQPDSTQRQ